MNRLAMIIAVLAMLGSSAAFEAEVFVPYERTLVADLGEDFYISVGTIDPSYYVFKEGFEITNDIGKVWVRVFTPYNDPWRMLSKESFLGTLLGGVITELGRKGGYVTGNWTTTSYYGDPVVVYDAKLPPDTVLELPFNTDVWVYCETSPMCDVYFATWYAGENSYITLISTLDRETTSQIISTARIV